MNLEMQPFAVHLDARSVDQIELGVLRVDSNGSIVYANRAATETLGAGTVAGSSLFDLDLEPESRERLKSELAARKANQHGSDYQVRMRRRDDGALLELHLAGVPEFSPEHQPVGSVAFLSDVTMTGVNRAIHDAIGEASGWQDLLDELCETLHEVIAFDSLLITLVSSDRLSLRVLFDEKPMESAPGHSWRWWPMPAMVKSDLDKLTTTRADCVATMFEQSPYRELKEDDEPTKMWLECGYTHLLRRPVMHGNRLSAILVAQRKTPDPFNAVDIARLEQLPIGEVVNMALALEREEDMRFGISLMGSLGAASGSISRVASVLVDELRNHFSWPHVSLFRIDRDRGELLLMYQSAEPAAQLPQGYRQVIDDGLLGEVARTGEPVRAVNVGNQAGYIKGIDSTVSELCVPVPGQPVRWILNAESPLSGAFAEEEVRIVKPLLEVAGLILERTVALKLKNSVLESMADAVFETSSEGVIRDVNASGLRLIGRTCDELVGSNLAALLSAPGDDPDPPGFAARFVAAESIKPAKMELRAANGEMISVVMSGSSLPAEVGGNVYVATDLRFAEQVQRMDALRTVFRQVASEIRAPLSLASAFIQLAVSEGQKASSAGALDKALKQLRKADLPLERVVRLAAAGETAELPRSRVAVVDVIQAILDDLPEPQRQDVKLSVQRGSLAVGAGSFPDLRFCASTIMAFFLRMKAQRDRVLAHVGHVDGQPGVSFELIDADAERPSATRFQARSEHEREFALAEPVIDDLMRRMRGRFAVEQGPENLRIDLCLEPWREE